MVWGGDALSTPTDGSSTSMRVRPSSRPRSTAVDASSMSVWNEAGLYVSRPADRSSRCGCCCCCCATGGMALLTTAACRLPLDLLALRSCLSLERHGDLLNKPAGVLCI